MTTHTCKIGAVVFDWAGTMVDFGSCAPPGAFVRAFAEMGITITHEIARRPMGKAKREHIAAILEDDSVVQSWRRVFERSPTEQDIDRVYDLFLPIQSGCIAEHSGVIVGIPEAITRLRSRGIRIGSSTGYTRELMGQVLPQAEAQGLTVDVVITASDFAQGRPAPWMIFENARRLGVYPISRLVKVDDTVAGIAAGRNAGAWCVGVSRTGNLVGLSEQELSALDASEQQRLIDAATQQLFDAGAHLVLESAADIVSAVDQIESVMLEHALSPTATHQRMTSCFPPSIE